MTFENVIKLQIKENSEIHPPSLSGAEKVHVGIFKSLIFFSLKLTQGYLPNTQSHVTMATPCLCHGFASFFQSTLGYFNTPLTFLSNCFVYRSMNWLFCVTVVLMSFYDICCFHYRNLELIILETLSLTPSRCPRDIPQIAPVITLLQEALASHELQQSWAYSGGKLILKKYVEA